MNAFESTFILLGCLISIAYSHDWPALKAKWGYIPLLTSNYVDLVRKGNYGKDKWEVARDKGWDLQKLWNVKAYCLKNDPSICTLYDVSDHIVGLQIGLPVSSVDAFGSPLNFKNKRHAKKINRMGVDVYVMSLFFVDPEEPELFITGRKEWTGNIGDGLWLVEWDQGTNTFVKIPTSLEEMVPAGYSRHNCVAGMGTHYFKDLDYNTACSALFPLFVTFDDDRPIGFGIQTLGHQYFNKYSKWNEVTIGYPSITEKIPTCLRLSSIYPGMIVTHFYFTPEPTLLKCEN